MQAAIQEPLFQRIFTLLTGARSGERAKSLFSFAALFFLLASYYLVKPLRSSQFLKEFDPNLMPVFFLLIALLSFGLTKAFNFFYDRINTYRLIGYTFALMMGLKICFLLSLPKGGKLASLLFYLWAAVYFLLCNAVLWGCINSLYHSESAERCFGFVSIGAAAGGIIGSMVSEWLASSSYTGYSLFISALLMGLSLLFMYRAINVSETASESKKEKKVPSKSPFWTDVLHLWQHRYIRAIATMVFALAVLNTVLEFQGLKLIDSQLSQQQYLVDFQELNQALNRVQKLPGQSLNPEGYQFIRELKHSSDSDKLKTVSAFLKQENVKLSAQKILSDQKNFQNNLESRTRELLSKIYKNQGFIGVFLLFVAARPLYKWIGLRWVMLLLPILFGTVCLAMFFPIELLTLEWMLTSTYALNYSLYRTSKELLYTQTDNEARFKLKPLIEGPIMRLGDVTASVLKLSLMGIMVLFLGQPEARMDQVYLLCALIILVYWLYEAWFVGGRYESLRKASEGPAAESQAETA
ncbi:hypothetical protein COW36_05660 [bacterium (Candidatus Blackallbacteria) CG17_big_fil_post_rev_8_21_14_2_50_48_46]|uniref:ADP,ATP carrier protein n=1 Tax=bacterium (Candidatus Blackallbacteria) CG17_big_fil_post_rev_8_21_14_2_50_48_46 TaxID=2014261 RepID=A0A2M7G849_9BACT|nr:MAG: hypothetical protein COW64_21255 [bacterium (Candidatus Blackallbacteria) CG18_big_fil_WC_8_21_14_2_50_49_26]PIW18254.1 MAG: hypothetical protein COW36_05660 [bacterium (Candidatus Blackallbacteria) CG17_big_fil_post_rev_8_21_14_2_50_48_46]PIW50685.1 MAG: hypothetical protein COW20_01925 [bacterium (Candidatus Blackallbacteria) CG13_big_fil_rev_8_21_14_2_50_49_14]